MKNLITITLLLIGSLAYSQFYVRPMPSYECYSCYNADGVKTNKVTKNSTFKERHEAYLKSDSIWRYMEEQREEFEKRYTLPLITLNLDTTEQSELEYFTTDESIVERENLIKEYIKKHDMDALTKLVGSDESIRLMTIELKRYKAANGIK